MINSFQDCADVLGVVLPFVSGSQSTGINQTPTLILFLLVKSHCIPFHTQQSCIKTCVFSMDAARARTVVPPTPPGSPRNRLVVFACHRVRVCVRFPS